MSSIELTDTQVMTQPGPDPQRTAEVDAIVEAIAFGPDGTLYAAIEREG
ncbi:hypothetical protein [Mycolicibacterium poriferae]|nr:hypothetical protein [Mycolicibacterium poriferae]